MKFYCIYIYIYITCFRHIYLRIETRKIGQLHLVTYCTHGVWVTNWFRFIEFVPISRVHITNVNNSYIIWYNNTTSVTSNWPSPMSRFRNSKKNWSCRTRAIDKELLKNWIALIKWGKVPKICSEAFTLLWSPITFNNLRKLPWYIEIWVLKNNANVAVEIPIIIDKNNKFWIVSKLSIAYMKIFALIWNYCPSFELRKSYYARKFRAKNVTLLCNLVTNFDHVIINRCEIVCDYSSVVFRM